MNNRIQSLLTLALLCFALPALAGQAYTWTDRHGVTHFSESAPPDPVQDAERVELESAPVIPGMAPERYRSISTQAARMRLDRLKREQAREKRRQMEAKRYRERLDAYEDEYDDRVSEYYFYPYPYWHRPRPRHHHPRHRHRPHRPHEPSRHEFRAGKTITQKQNAEALRGHRWHR